MRNIAFVGSIVISTPDEEFANREISGLYLFETDLRGIISRLINDKTGGEWILYREEDPTFSRPNQFVVYVFHNSNNESAYVEIGISSNSRRSVKRN